MIKARHVVQCAIMFVVVSSTLHAQGGCTDSPEAPTIVLMLLGAGGVFGSSLVNRLVRRRLQSSVELS